ncbi:hypothetical protein [Shewanella subflava]|uniref:Uncharacterized protein n=1 Tax=Shewanella subflava TaxID=2986476 RepID=A0ABT3IA84_9GAMM|nr:hypothetical protein [Shewanella subflava]MCW3172932.1 hypothetical protein [Shewanella subflava]
MELSSQFGRLLALNQHAVRDVDDLSLFTGAINLTCHYKNKSTISPYRIKGEQGTLTHQTDAT